MRYTTVILLAWLLCSCAGFDKSEPVIRLDLQLAVYAGMSPSAQSATLDSLRPELDAMFAVLGYSEVTASMLDQWSRGDVVRVFQPAVDSIFSDTHSLEVMVGEILYRASADSLGLPPLRFATVTWGSQRPIVRVDSIVLIALNHYLGSDYPGYAQWPDYRRRDKRPEMLPYDLAGALAATRYPIKTDDSSSLLTWLLYEGALTYARMRLVPDADPAMALGFSEAEYRFAEEHYREMYEEMAVRRLFYDTDPVTIDRYIAAAPSTPLMQGKAPGRVGRYIGYRIVKEYIKNNGDPGLRYLLSPAFYADPQTLITAFDSD